MTTLKYLGPGLYVDPRFMAHQGNLVAFTDSEAEQRLKEKAPDGRDKWARTTPEAQGVKTDGDIGEDRGSLRAEWRTGDFQQPGDDTGLDI
jgi:hypothetical protein